jgi:hypothetical protein
MSKVFLGQTELTPRAIARIEQESILVSEGVLPPNYAIESKYLFFLQQGNDTEINAMMGILAAEDKFMDGLDADDFYHPQKDRRSS